MQYPPVLVLEALVGAYAAALYGLITGRPLSRLAYLLPAALAGALLGQLVGEQLQVPGLVVGDLHVLEAAVGAWALLLIVVWLRV